MAGYTLIDGYLDTMRHEIQWRRDLDDVVAEMQDHLYSAVETRLARGLEPTAAQRATLDLFGEPRVLAAVYASTPTGGIAVPTTSTVRAGLFALVAGVMWLLSGFNALIGYTQGSNWILWYAAFSATVLAGGVLGILAVIGVKERLGGMGRTATIGMAVFGGGVVFSIIAWAVPFWMGLQGIGLLIFGTVALRLGVAPKVPTIAVAYGPLLGVATFAAITAAQIGPVDSYGDYEWAWVFGNSFGLALMAIGFFGWGRWLRGEKPADIDRTDMPVTA